MQRFVFGFLTLFLVPVTLAQKWDVTLASGQTYTNVRLEHLWDDSLHFDTGTYRVLIPLNNVSSVTSSDKLRLPMWGLLGGFYGYYGGFRFGEFFANEIFEMPRKTLKLREDPVVLFPTATGAVLGTVFGVDYARKTQTNHEYDFSRMSPEEKLKTIDEILKKRHKGITAKGVKVGLNLANAAGDSVEDTKSKPGLAIGGYLTYAINDWFAVQPEVHYSMKGYKIDESEMGITVKGKTSLSYLDMPILGVYSAQDNIKLFAGPSLGFYLSGKSEVEISGEFGRIAGEADIESDYVNRLDFGLVLGGTYAKGKISVDVRHSTGLRNFMKEQDGVEFDAENRLIQLIVGYSF